jgi:hypothetical protein
MSTLSPKRLARIAHLESLGAVFNETGYAVNPQNANFLSFLDRYKFEDTLGRFTDYFKVATIEDIEYYSPNDEGLGCIVAIDRKAKLLIATEFFEMDDMETCPHWGLSEYRIVNVNGKLMCDFENKNS